MMQEHPYFSNPQIFFGKALNDIEDIEETEEMLAVPWSISFGELQYNPSEPIGLFFFWNESSPTDEIHFS